MGAKMLVKCKIEKYLDFIPVVQIHRESIILLLLEKKNKLKRALKLLKSSEKVILRSKNI